MISVPSPSAAGKWDIFVEVLIQANIRATISNLTTVVDEQVVSRAAIRLYSPKFHNASLRIEGKVRDVNVTRALVNCRWFPNDSSVAIQNGLVHYCNHVITVSATMLFVVVVVVGRAMRCDVFNFGKVRWGKRERLVGWTARTTLDFIHVQFNCNFGSSYSDLAGVGLVINRVLYVF